MKKVISYFSVIAVLFVLIITLLQDIPVVSAASTTSGIVYEVNGKEVTITDYTGSDTVLVIPEKINGKKVTYIAERAFERCTRLVSIQMPDGIKGIGKCAFYYCRGIESVVIPEGVTEIGQGAFADCVNLLSVTLPHTLEKIDDCAFENCTNLTSIVISHSVRTIGYGVFRNCSKLINITIYDGVEQIKGEAFKGTAYYNDSSMWDEGLLYIDHHLVAADSSLVSGDVVICDGTRTIADGTFNECADLTLITIPEGVKRIGLQTFYNCRNLTSVSLPSSVLMIDDQAFSWDPITEIYYGGTPDQWVNIYRNWYLMPDGGNLYFNGELLTDIVLTDKVTTIGSYAFYGCLNIRSITIPDSVTTIDRAAFRNCTNLSSIDISDNVSTIGNGAFKGTAYYNNRANWDQGLLYIGNHLIEADGSRIGRTVFVRDGTKTIASRAFNDGYILYSITIPDSVIYIGDYAFYWCENLTDVHYGGSEIAWKNIRKTVYNQPLLAAEIHFAKVSGDLNNNGDVTITDAVLLYYHINGRTSLSNDIGADLNSDGKVNIADAVSLYYFVNGKTNSL